VTTGIRDNTHIEVHGDVIRKRNRAYHGDDVFFPLHEIKDEEEKYDAGNDLHGIGRFGRRRGHFFFCLFSKILF